MTRQLEHYFLRLWAHNVSELHRQQDTIDRIAFRMQNRALVMCYTQWMVFSPSPSELVGKNLMLCCSP